MTRTQAQAHTHICLFFSLPQVYVQLKFSKFRLRLWYYVLELIGRSEGQKREGLKDTNNYDETMLRSRYSKVERQQREDGLHMGLH